MFQWTTALLIPLSFLCGIGAAIIIVSIPFTVILQRDNSQILHSGTMAGEARSCTSRRSERKSTESESSDSAGSGGMANTDSRRNGSLSEIRWVYIGAM